MGKETRGWMVLWQSRKKQAESQQVENEGVQGWVRNKAWFLVVWQLIMLIMLWSWSWHGLEHIAFFITRMMLSCCLFRGAKWKLWVWTVHCWWESLGSARHKVWSVAAMCFLQPEVHRFLPSSTSFSSAMRIPTSSESCIWEELNFLSAVLNGSANNSGWKQQNWRINRHILVLQWGHHSGWQGVF